MNNQFFVFEFRYGSNHQLFAGGQYVNDTSIRCPLCCTFLKADNPPEINIELNHIGKLGFTEYLWNSHSLPIFRSDLIGLWKNSDVTGFTTRPIHVTGWYKKPKIPVPPSIPTYFQLDVSNTVKLIEPKAMNSPCPNCGFIHFDFPKVGNYLPNGIQIDNSSWEGTDFFTLIGYNILFCTRHVVEATLRAGYSKCISFIRAEDWGRWEEFNIKKWDIKSYETYLENFLIRDVRDLA